MKKKILSCISLALVLVISLIPIPQTVFALDYVTESTYDFSTFDSSLNNSSFVVKKYTDIGNDTNALGITANDAVNNGIRKIPIKIPIENQKKYEISFRYYAKAGTQIENLEIITVDDPVDLVWNDPYVSQIKIISDLGLDAEKGTDGQWKTLTAPITFTANTMKDTTECPYLALKVKKAATTAGNFGFYIDDLSVKQVTAPSLNYVTDKTYTFDETDVTWDNTGSLRVNKIDGIDNTGKVIFISSKSAIPNGNRRMPVAIPIANDTDYKVSFKYYAKADNRLTGLVLTTCKSSDSSGQGTFVDQADLYSRFKLTENSTGGKWKTATVYFKSNTMNGATECPYISLKVKVNAGDTSDVGVYIDDLTIKQEKAPHALEYVTDATYDFETFKADLNNSSFRVNTFTDIDNDTKVLSLTNTGASGAINDGVRKIPIEIPLKDKQHYEVSFRYYAKAGTQIENLEFMTVDSLTSISKNISQSAVYEQLALDPKDGTEGEWWEVKTSFTADTFTSDDEEVPFLALKVKKAKTADTELGFFIDDLTVKAVDTPLTPVTDKTYTFDESGVSWYTVGSIKMETINGIGNDTKVIYPQNGAVTAGNRRLPVDIVIADNTLYKVSFKYYSKEAPRLTALALTSMKTTSMYTYVEQAELFSKLELDSKNSTGGQWKTATIYFKSNIMKDDVECPILSLKFTTTKLEGATDTGFYIDDFSITELSTPELIIDKDYKLETNITGTVADFGQAIKLNGSFAVTGNDSKGIYVELDGKKAYVKEAGIMFRPLELSDVSSFDNKNALTNDNAIERVPLNAITAEGNTVKISSAIEGLYQQYGKTKFEIAVYAVFDFEGIEIAKLGDTFKLSVKRVYNLNDEYASNTNLKAWIEGIE